MTSVWMKLPPGSFAHGMVAATLITHNGELQYKMLSFISLLPWYRSSGAARIFFGQPVEFYTVIPYISAKQNVKHNHWID